MRLFQKKDHEKAFINRLKEDYINELLLSQQMKNHAETARYKQYKEKLYELSKSEKEQAEVIKEILEKLGADVPAEIPSITKRKERNLFEALNRDLEMDHQDYFHYYERIHEAQEEGFTDILPILNRLRNDEEEHRQTLFYILQRLNPYQI